MVTHCVWLSHLFSLFTYRTADLAKLFRNFSHLGFVWMFLFSSKFSLNRPWFYWRGAKWVTSVLRAKKKGETPALPAGSVLCHPACPLGRVKRTVPRPVTHGAGWCIWAFLVMGKQLQGLFLGRLLHSPLWQMLPRVKGLCGLFTCLKLLFCFHVFSCPLSRNLVC